VLGWCTQGYSQQDSLNRDAAPSISLNRLVLEYYRIDFEPEIREELTGVELELIYLIDSFGYPYLEEVNGTSNTIIRDSLVERTKVIPLFSPALTDGVPVESLYFIRFSYPSYSQGGQLMEYDLLNRLQNARIEDFEFIEEDGSRFDIPMGIHSNFWSGNAADFLRPGGGMKVDIIGTFKNQVSAGLSLNFFFNRRYNEFDLATNREQLRSTTGALMGLSIGKWIDFRDRKQAFHLNFEANYALLNVTENQGDNDPDWVQFRGFSPGVVLSFPIWTIAKKPIINAFSSGVQYHELASHLAFRPMLMNQNQGSGILFEVGLHYRLSMRYVKDYQLKPEVFE